MGWGTIEGHEGWGPAVFPDGRLSVGSSGGGAMVRGPDDRLEKGVDGRTAIGWQAACECGWRGPLWRRVATAGEHAPDRHQVFVPDVDRYGDAAEELQAAMRAEWSGHAADARDPLEQVREQAREAGAAQARLTDAVHAARQAGHSWADIGQAVGITRQSAHERWARLTTATTDAAAQEAR
ncbi:hypothetical protein Ssi03_77330 [Sphaerisporangium siamense]|uniref:AsnC family protein n=1 Tax=Sphaerisporangium siamense TaxID=795645 RepID=A0A7W7DFW6_9ACTN|nr:hypothetical protein [Sphaerisporangium siamense]MBB4706155.1 hypothetical protein [Sphaerisporangium siamense]GII89743.1 hypothetical protein Ssi03_77330 [Sphaerisporangium siamense]